MDDDRFLDVTRQLAKTLLNNPYMTVKDFLVSMTDQSLSDLLEDVEALHGAMTSSTTTPTISTKLGHNAVVVAELLSSAEGVPTIDTDHLVFKTRILGAFLAIESLTRRGFTQCIRENMSFGEEMKNKPIAREL